MKPTIIHTVLVGVYNHQREFSHKLYCSLPGKCDLSLAMSQNQNRDEALEQCLEALAVAKDTIKALHGREGWEEYQNSPEMKKINNALAFTGV